MTTLQALKANIADTHGIALSENAFLKALIDIDLGGNEVYTKAAYEQSIDMATVKLYRLILDTANVNDGDRGYSLTNKEHIKSCIDNLLRKWGLPAEFGGSSGPQITGASPW